MPKSPLELQAVARRAMEKSAAEKKKIEQDRKDRDCTRTDFESACLSAALQRKNQISFHPKIAQVVDLRSFTIEEIKLDLAREKFLASKYLELEGVVSFKLGTLASAFPSLVVSIFPNGLANNFEELVKRCAHDSTPESLVAAIKMQIWLALRWKPDIPAAFDRECLSFADDWLTLNRLRYKLGTVAGINAEMPDDLDAALRISWSSVEAGFERAGILTSSKLKWISTIWPKWEKHFSEDIERAAHSGATSRTWLFSPADGWEGNYQFSVNAQGVTPPDLELMTAEELATHFYWEEIIERDGDAPRYDEGEGLLVGVHPLPVTEIFSFRGFEIKLERLSFINGMFEGDSIEICASDLENCSTDYNYRLTVSWDEPI